jgi:hypothetical protein
MQVLLAPGQQRILDRRFAMSGFLEGLGAVLVLLAKFLLISLFGIALILWHLLSCCWG